MSEFRKRVVNSWRTSLTGLALVIAGGIGLYNGLDATVCGAVVLGGLALLGAKE